MKQTAFPIFAFLIAVLGGATALAHDVITTKITFDREIARIVYARCASCHRPGGAAFSLVTYDEARPWAKAIQEEVLERRMPPWGAVKGFGDFRNDQALTPEQIEVIADWVEGGAPEGEPKDLPALPKFGAPSAADRMAGSVSLSGDDKLQHAMVLAGLIPMKVEPGASFQITAELPDGHIEPLLWLQPFKPAYGHAFWLRTPLKLPRGTIIRGLSTGSTIALLPPP